MLPPGLSMRSTTAATSSSFRASPQELRQRVAADGARRLLAVQDLARGHDDADGLVAALAERLLGAHVRQVAVPVDGGESRVFVLADFLRDDFLELVARLEPVDQAARERVLGQVAAGRAHAVGRLVRVGLDQRSGSSLRAAATSAL